MLQQLTSAIRKELENLKKCYKEMCDESKSLRDRVSKTFYLFSVLNVKFALLTELVISNKSNFCSLALKKNFKSIYRKKDFVLNKSKKVCAAFIKALRVRCYGAVLFALLLFLD